MSVTISAPPAGSDLDGPCTPGSMLERYRAVRRQTEILAEPLEPEDFVVQSMPDASPVKWHLAHTTWFFETFVLTAALPDYRPRFPQYNYLFNSYYNAVGERIARDKRGLLSRPSIAEVRRYRDEVDARVEDWVGSAGDESLASLGSTFVLGLHHEQQHQELILTDLKHAFASNPLRPIYRDRDPDRPAEPIALSWTSFSAGLRRVGHEGSGFAFDNEGPRHPQYVGAFELANRLATNGEYLGFIADGGYNRPESWLSDGWVARKNQGWTAPLYWEKADGRWVSQTLAGPLDIALCEPVTHVSFYEADAFARWSGARLATEAEWETAAQGRPIEGNFVESGRYHPAAAKPDEAGPLQLFGDAWEWTGSPYTPYPGYRAAAGALGEYNGKFMCNTIILRGGSCATPRSHVRATYRNFFGPEARWQFTGIRLARDPG